MHYIQVHQNVLKLCPDHCQRTCVFLFKPKGQCFRRMLQCKCSPLTCYILWSLRRLLANVWQESRHLSKQPVHAQVPQLYSLNLFKPEKRPAESQYVFSANNHCPEKRWGGRKEKTKKNFGKNIQSFHDFF